MRSAAGGPMGLLVPAKTQKKHGGRFVFQKTELWRPPKGGALGRSSFIAFEPCVGVQKVCPKGPVSSPRSHCLRCPFLRDSSNESAAPDAVSLSMSMSEIEDPEVKGKKKRGRPGKQQQVSAPPRPVVISCLCGSSVGLLWVHLAAL